MNMNIYVRYFDQEALACSFDELADFLSSIPDIHLTHELLGEVRGYVESDMPYPKRMKIRPRVYFIMIKTTASTLEEFKNNRKQNLPDMGMRDVRSAIADKKEQRMMELTNRLQGWYKGTMVFKRVVPVEQTGKFQYVDTTFIACVYTDSAIDCYNRMVDYLRSRGDVDMRSQFPSSRGQNYRFDYLGTSLPQEIIDQSNSMSNN